MESVILLIEELSGREPEELARLGRGGPVDIGRDPGPTGLALKFQAVSRTHGRIIPLGSYWFYQDLGSTNGSWLNGEPVPAQAIRIIRSGDMVQLADAILRVTEISDTGIVINEPRKDRHPRSLVVLEQDRFVAEYPVPDYGRALVVGGPGAHLEIQGAMQNAPSLVIERKGMFTSASGASAQIPALLNGQVVGEPIPISDGQQISVGNFLIIYCEPATLETGLTIASGSGWSTSKSANELNRQEGRSDDSGGSFLNKPAHGTLFGKPLEVQEDGLSVSSTVRIDPALLQQRLGRDVHPSMRNPLEAPKGFSFDLVEERLVLVIGFFLLLTLLALLVLWLFV